MAKVEKGETRDRQSGGSGPSGKKGNIPFNLGEAMEGLGGLLEKLGQLAEAGEKLSRSGQFQDATGKLRGVYGIHVKTGLGRQGEEELKVEPFGNIRPQPAEQPPGDDVREPLVDVHEEDDHVLVLVELPGVAKEDVTLELAGDRLNLAAQRAKTRYVKEIPLPGQFSEDHLHWECKNGILQIRLNQKNADC